MRTFKGSYKDGAFCFERTEFLKACMELGDFEVLVCTPEEAISERQFRWYKMTVRKLAEQTGNSQDHWEVVLMNKCGHGLFEVEFKPNIDGEMTAKRPSVKSLSKSDMHIFMENILDYAYSNDLDIKPPDWNNRYK